MRINRILMRIVLRMVLKEIWTDILFKAAKAGDL